MKYQIERKLLDEYDLLWSKTPQFAFKDCLVIVDTSGSMDGANALAPALALGYINSTNCQGFFKNKMITFSSKPSLIEFKNNKLSYMLSMTPEIIENTDIAKVFELLLSSFTLHNLNESDMPKFLLIISDGEFDEMSDNSDDTIFEHYEKKFMKHNLKLPKIIFWNMGYSHSKVATKDNSNVILVSSNSANLVKDLSTLTLDRLLSFSPYTAMVEVLSKYEKYL